LQIQKQKLKKYTDAKAQVMREIKQRKGQSIKPLKESSINGLSNPIKFILGALGLTGLGALGWHLFKPKPSKTATPPEAMPTTSTKQA
jgi:hypothetical protein